VEPSAVNVANGLTVARILCTPPLILLVLATPEGSYIAAAVFGALALTDALDGHLARTRNLITTLGKLLDPFADKLLVGGALLALVATDRLALAVAVVIIAREVIVSVLRQVAYREGVVIPAGTLGKAKMALQVTMILALLAFGPASSPVLQALVIATVAMTVMSGLSYLSAIPRMRLAREGAAAG
jgi:CDP-diacylglycerol--glycerol-3-phosphate 3-phosphatidyltransferase